MKRIKNLKFEKVFPWVLTVGGALGMLAAIILTMEKIHILQNPNYTPSCTLSPIVACSPVITSPQSSAFGFPNVFIGIATFAMVLTVGMTLFAGGTMKRWYWLIFQAGTVFGVGFISWLMYQSLYNIGKLCLYCMLVWAVTIPIFWVTLAYNVRSGNIKTKGKLKEVLANHSGKLIAGSYLIIILLIFFRFRDYWYSLIG